MAIADCSAQVVRRKEEFSTLQPGNDDWLGVAGSFEEDRRADAELAVGGVGAFCDRGCTAFEVGDEGRQRGR